MVLDGVGGAPGRQALVLLAPGGRMVVFAAAAHHALESRATVGKTLLIPTPMSFAAASGLDPRT